MSVVAFTPDDLEVVKAAGSGVASGRAVFSRFPFPPGEAGSARALKNLAASCARRRSEPAYLEAYDETLAKAGARISPAGAR